MAFPFLSPSSFSIETAKDAVASLFDLREGFAKGYVLELWDSRRPERALQTHVMVVPPRSHVLTEPFQVTLTPTQDNTVTAEEAGIIVREVSIEGTYGISDKRATGFDGAQFGGSPVSGDRHFKDLRDLHRRYSEMKKDAETAPFTYMVFHSLRDDDHWVVVPRSFETPRDSRSSRVHYEWRFTLAAIGEAQGIERLTEDDGFDIFFTDDLATISRGFNNARAFFAEITAATGKEKRKIANINAVMLNAAGMLNAVGNMLRAGADLIEFPLRLVPSILASIDNAVDSVAQGGSALERSLRRMGAAIDEIAIHPARFGPSSTSHTSEMYRRESALTEQDLARNEAGATVGSKTRILAGGLALEGIDLGNYAGVHRELVLRTSTIDGFAARFGVARELIVIINDLRFPYIARGGGPGILAPGDYILIPIRTGAAGAVGGPGPDAEYLSTEESLYGVDLALDQEVLAKEGRFEILEDDTRYLLDAQLVHGLENVVQGVTISIRTELGTTTYLPDIGIRRGVGKKGTIQHVLLSALALREAVLSDPRIEGIQDSTVVLDGDVLTQEVSPILASRRRDVSLILPFGRASGVG